MEENTTPSIQVDGQTKPHPAVRRLARACISLVLWQRKQLNVDQAALQVQERTVMAVEPHDDAQTAAQNRDHHE